MYWSATLPHKSPHVANAQFYIYAYNDLWSWPISSRSFGLGLENRVRSVASTVQDGFFPYLVQMITSMRRCVACDDLWPWPISSRYVEIRQSVEHSACVTGCYRTANDTWNSNVHKRCHASPWQRICCVMTSTEWRHKRGVPEVGLGCQGKLTQFGGENG